MCSIPPNTSSIGTLALEQHLNHASGQSNSSQSALHIATARLQHARNPTAGAAFSAR